MRTTFNAPAPMRTLSNSGSPDRDGTITDRPPLPYPATVTALARCVVSTVRLLVRRETHLRRVQVGMRLRFADGTSARVYRETVVDQPATRDPCVLAVEFKLRAVHGWGHAAFRCESLFNTPLFLGFPGFVSKLWLTNDELGNYRGLYEWDSASCADYYARALWRVLQLVCVPGSIHYVILPGMRRDDLLAMSRPDADFATWRAAWWRPVEIS